MKLRILLNLSVLTVALCGLTANVCAQSAPANSMSTPEGNETDTQVAVPGGAGATATPAGQPSAGPILGFQVWQQDRYLLSSFFTFAVPQTFSGQPPVSPQTVSAQQNSFGALLLNPPGQGTSFTFIGNKVWGWYPNPGGFFRQGDKQTVANAYLFAGFEARAGITNTTWTEQTTNPQSLTADIVYFAPEALFTSATYNVTSGSATNQYQYGFAIGPSFRFIGGDVAQKGNAGFLSDLLGTTKTHMTGLEITFFVRMNQFKPFVRISHFAPPGGSDISGFSGSQFVFGVDVLSPLFQTSLSK